MCWFLLESIREINPEYDADESRPSPDRNLENIQNNEIIIVKLVENYRHMHTYTHTEVYKCNRMHLLL